MDIGRLSEVRLRPEAATRRSQAPGCSRVSVFGTLRLAGSCAVLTLLLVVRALIAGWVSVVVPFSPSS